MSFVIARWIVGIFTCISMVHLYWAAGGKLGSLAAIPQLPANSPAGHARRLNRRHWALFWWRWGWWRLRCSCVFGLGFISRQCPMGHCSGGISAIALVMFARAIGDSELVGFFKKVSGSRFASMDTWFYSPLCLALGVGLLVVAWG